MIIKNKYLLTPIIFVFLSTNILAQNEYDFKQFINEASDYYTAPLNWDSNDFLTFGIVAVSTYGLMYLDESIKNEFSKINSNKKNWLMEVGRYWGEPIPSIALSGLLLLHGYVYDNNSTKKIGFEVGQSFLYSVSVTSALKIVFGRSRPYTGHDPFTFDPISFTDSKWSHPSGHTTVAFSLSTVLAANTENTAWKIAAFIPAFLTAISRVYQDYHWTSDVFLGGIIGYFTGKFITDLHNEKELNGQIQTTPLISLSLSF